MAQITETAIAHVLRAVNMNGNCAPKYYWLRDKLIEQGALGRREDGRWTHYYATEAGKEAMRQLFEKGV